MDEQNNNPPTATDSSMTEESKNQEPKVINKNILDQFDADWVTDALAQKLWDKKKEKIVALVCELESASTIADG